MNVHNQQIVDDFIADHADARSAMQAWLAEAKNATWKTPLDIKKRYPSASIVAELIVFNIKGDNYRLVVKINYKNQIVLIKKIGTHAEYDKWNLK